MFLVYAAHVSKYRPDKIEMASSVVLSRPSPPLRPISWAGDIPLSFAQQRLWYLDHLMPSSPIYNIASAIRLNGQLHLAASSGR